LFGGYPSLGRIQDEGFFMTRQTRTKIAAAFGIAGFLCAAAMALWGNTNDLRHVQLSDLHVLVVSGPSAALSGWLCASLFGHPKGLGWFLAGNGALLSTVLGAAIAGTLISPILGTIIAPLEVFWNFGAYPIVGLVWLSCMAALHYLVMISKR
jgi:hypothetical protein